MKNWIYITIFGEKVLNQCKEQTKSKVTSGLPLYKASSWLSRLSLCKKSKVGSQIYSLVYKFNVCFIRLENLVYQNNSFIIYIRQSSIQHATVNQLNIRRLIFLNISFSINISLTEISRSINRICYFWILLILQLFCLRSKFQHYSMDFEFQCHSLFKQGLP